MAQEPKPTVVAEKPTGLRVMSGGHSWSTENSAPLCQAAGITGHIKLNKQGLNSGRIEDLTPLLEKGEIDAYVWQNSLGAEFPNFLPTLVELGPKHNPNFRGVFIQMPWLVHDGRNDVKLPEEYEQTDLAEMQVKIEKYRKQQEAYVDEVNAKAGKRVVFLVPLGDGMLEVRKMIAAGKFPGVTKVSGSVLGGDHMPHQGLLGMRLGAYMHFAALYRMSPEGLKFPGKEGDGLTDEQRSILQKLAWDMVSKYPCAGIAKFEGPQPPKENAKVAPKTGALAAETKPPGKPNVIFILTDDLGYSDLSCYGSPNIKTPCLDRMAREGVRFTDFYAAGSVCTPTRASLLTGCYPKRVGLHRGVLPTHSEKGLHPDEVTLAELLQGQGYATACIGKWHLGTGLATLPTSQGFDSYFGMPGDNHGKGELYRGTEIIEQAGKINISELTQRYTTEAVEFITKSKDKPFFLYLPHGAPHTPLYASKNFHRKSAAGLRGDMIEEVDWSVGQVLQTVKALNLDGKTLVIFTSDNGHDAIPRPPLHGRKSQCWEGGFRVPCIARWPGRVPAGAECREMTVMFDWLPTLASLAGTEPPVKRTIDGKDIWQTLCSKAKTPHDHFVYYNIAGSASAIRCGRWKLHVLPSGGGDGEDLLARKPAEAPPWLYDLEADLGETQNVAKAHPDVVKLLREKLQHTDKVLTQEARPVWDNPKNAAPKTGVGAMAMPEALKGWKATQDLPADTVVTDYNDYIEKLPGVERFGVADVKYYVDDTGRNAVAILVNVGDTQWTHLLVYDKQDKRTGVTKFVDGK